MIINIMKPNMDILYIGKAPCTLQGLNPMWVKQQQLLSNCLVDLQKFKLVQLQQFTQDVLVKHEQLEQSSYSEPLFIRWRRCWFLAWDMQRSQHHVWLITILVLKLTTEQIIIKKSVIFKQLLKGEGYKAHTQF